MRLLSFVILIFFLFVSFSLVFAEVSDNPQIGKVVKIFGKKVIEIEVNNPEKVKLKSKFFICRNNDVIAKIEVYSIKKDSILAQILESEEDVAVGDEIKEKGEVDTAQALDPMQYMELMVPIIAKVGVYTKTFAEATSKFMSYAQANKGVRLEPGSQEWYSHLYAMQNAFIDPQTRKVLISGDDDLSKTIKTLKSITPPKEFEKIHKRILSICSQLKPLYFAFKQIPLTTSQSDMNYLVQIHNTYFTNQGNLRYTIENLGKSFLYLVTECKEAMPDFDKKEEEYKNTDEYKGILT